MSASPSLERRGREPSVNYNSLCVSDLATFEKHRLSAQYLPWITLSLAGLLCAVHAFAPLVENVADFRTTFGVIPGKYHTYLAYGFIHADLKHLLTNIFTLLLFGTVVELQAGRLLFISVILIAVVAGAVCAMAFPYPTHIDLSGRIIGFSAAGWALTVLGLAVLVRHWDVGPGLFWAALLFLAALLVTESWSLVFGRVTPAIGGSVMSLAGLGIGVLVLSRHFIRTALCIVIPALSMLWPLTALLHALWMHPGEVAHLTGAVVGALFLFPVLRKGAAGSPTHADG